MRKTAVKLFASRRYIISETLHLSRIMEKQPTVRIIAIV